MKNYISQSRLLLSATVIALSAIFNSCEIQEDFTYQKSNSTGQLNVTAWDFIQNTPALESLEKAIRLTNLEDLYQDNEVRTFIAPTNEAFDNYLKNNAYLTLEDVPLPILRNTIKYHVVNNRVVFTDPALFESNQNIAYQTENGQVMYLSHNTNFVGEINRGTSKTWQITTSNIEPMEDAMHIVNDIVYFSAPSGNLDLPDLSVERDTIFPIYDTYINGGSSSSKNFGGDILMKVKNVTGNGDYDRKAYMMFDFKDFKKPGVITDVKLEMGVKFTAAKGVSMNLFAIPDTSWTEMGLTFDSATLPSGSPIASVTTKKVSQFDFNVTDFYNNIGKKRVTLALDGQEGSDETDEFATVENKTIPAPMLIATLASGNSTLSLETNTGFTGTKGGAFVWNKGVLETTGAAAADIIYIVEETPKNGWLIKGASILKVGDRFTQNDIDLMNLVYINNDMGTSDSVVLSARDKAGASLKAFTVSISF
ncbi:Cadherin-like [Spirosomataceae bacterium TFI 002]|nr:Cadherin-like [Spirosomataceae bacterium TFI 002]